MKKTVCTFIVIVALILSASCSATRNQSSDTNGKSLSNPESVEDKISPPIIEENDILYISGNLDKINSYNSANDLYGSSENVFSGTVVSSESFFYKNTLQTISCICVETVYKGDFVSGNYVYVGEIGGRTTYGELIEGCNIEPKEFEKNTTPVSSDKKVVVGYDGYFTMQEGENVLLFTNLASINVEEISIGGFPAISYYILGGSDGKFHKVDESSFAKPKKSKNGNDSSDSSSKDETLIITLDELDLLMVSAE